MREHVLMTYYAKYLKNIRKVTDSSVKHYISAINTISKFLAQKDKLSKSIFEIEDIGQLEVIKAFLKEDPEFTEFDERGHRMYSVGFNNYYKFASGEGFKDIYQQIKILDIQVPIAKKKKREIDSWNRSSIIKIQSIQSAGYQCEANAEHKTFTTKNTGKQFMEGHHALPMKIQDKFSCSLDVYANIVCLCPTCHRLLHYGVDSEKEVVLDKIYYDRHERLATSGIRISQEEFKKLANL